MEKKTIKLCLTLTDLDWKRVNQLLAGGVCHFHNSEISEELEELRRVRDLFSTKLEKKGL